jgi:endoglucanase
MAVMQPSAVAPALLRLGRVCEAWQPPRWLRDASVVLAVALVVGVSAVVTGSNMFGSPHYESDEGTYVGSAWSMYNEGKLSYYTYNYDHPPLGWLVLGLWAKLLGGFLALGTSINTGRGLMLVVTVASALLILLIVRHVTGRLTGGVCAAVVFAASPLSIGLHRQVWLDNLATFWLLLSLLALLSANGGIGRVLLSALTFGIGFWTKEVIAVFLPAMCVLVVTQTHPTQRRFAVTLWLALAISLVSFFILLAFLKDELLPPGMLWSSTAPHVSLLDTYMWQVSRGGNGSILSPTGQFRQAFSQWSEADPLLVLGGIADAAIGLLLFRSHPALGGVSLMALTYLLFLARGGVVLYYYILPVLALLAVVLGLVQGYGMRVLEGVWRPLAIVCGPVLVVMAVVRGGLAMQADQVDFGQRPTEAQDAAAGWMIRTLPHESTVLMDSYAWVELRDDEATGGQPFTNAHYYWPGVSDPYVRDVVLHGNWRDVDYLAISPSILADLRSRELPILPEAIRNSDEVRTFFADNWTISIKRTRKLQAWPAQRDPFLKATWATYKEHYIQAGRVVNPKDGLTTSEAQSYALLRAVYQDDRETFDQVWAWTRAHLQVHEGDTLLAWHWGTDADGAVGVLDPNSAADADEDTALALLFAARRWGAPAYQDDAVRMLYDIWELETATVAERRILVGGNWARGGWSPELPKPVVNPSYFAPYAYRIFAEVDPSHAWQDLVDSSYDVLAAVRGAPEFGGAAGVVPNWLVLDPLDGRPQPAQALGNRWSEFSYDASRLPWRLALDWLWNQDDRSKESLAGLDLPRRELTASDRLAAAYNVDGTAAADWEATSMYAATLGGLLIGRDRDLAHHVFATKILHSYENDGANAFWGDVNDYYDQNWAWFATALMDGGMANLWAGQSVLNWDEVLP